MGDSVMGDAEAASSQQQMDMFRVSSTAGRVACCLCGVAMAPNAANMCVACVRNQVDITEGLQRHLTLLHCPECNSYLQPPRAWIKADLESKELLALCVKRIKNLGRAGGVRLVHAEFVWTEPHSRRIRVRLRVQKELDGLGGAVLEQSFVAEFVQQEHMCDSCSRAQANPDQFVAVVQVRQHVPHRRTLLFLEQLILRHGAAAAAVNIKAVQPGIDFFFGSRSHALKFVSFLAGVAPVQSRNDKQLVSHDPKSNVYNYKYSFSVQVCPVCKDDLVCLPPRVAASLGNLGPLVLCAKVSNSVLLRDPLTLRHAHLDAAQYWRVPFRALLSGRQLVEYVVLDVEPQQQGLICVAGLKFCLADVQVARVADFGKNDTMFSVRTHLGHLLKPGDYALGFDLYAANANDSELDKYRGLQIPEVILVKKSYEEKRLKKRGKPRSWKLKNLAMEMDASARARAEDAREAEEYERFLDELEEDQDMRSRIALFKNESYRTSAAAAAEDTDDDDVPEVRLDELLADLTIDEDAEEDMDG